LEYIYTDTISKASDSLYQLAITYQIPRLAAICEILLKKAEINLLLEFPSTFANDVKSIYLNSLVNEELVELVSSEEVSIKVPKFILFSADYFASMLRSGMQESVNSQIKLGEISEKSLRFIVSFMVTGIVESEDGNELMELLVGANQLCFSNLKECCELLLISLLDNDNAQLLLDFSTQFEAKRLLKACTSFIKNAKKEFPHFSLFLILFR
jgi:hypothetical protein